MISYWQERQRSPNGTDHIELTEPTFTITDGNEWVRSTQGEMSTAPAGWGIPRSLRTVRSAMQIPAPAESPATTIFSGGTALCGAFGGGLVKYRSETFSVSESEWVVKISSSTHKLRSHHALIEMY